MKVACHCSPHGSNDLGGDFILGCIVDQHPGVTRGIELLYCKVYAAVFDFKSMYCEVQISSYVNGAAQQTCLMLSEWPFCLEVCKRIGL